MERVIEILMGRDGVSRMEAEEMFNDCRQALLNETVPTGNLGLAEEILAEKLGLEIDYMTDLLL